MTNPVSRQTTVEDARLISKKLFVSIKNSTQLDAYLRLMRFHKPVGILLLWFPTVWALWIANNSAPPFLLMSYFLIGTVLMRAAGCIVNDIADREIDLHVKRTSMRPLTTGEVSLAEAFSLLAILLFCAVLVVTQLPIMCFYYSMFALFITVLYPFCKRFFAAPQLVLGVAFSMGIPMAYIASGKTLDASTLVLFLLNFAWIVSYDTMYAMVDKEDDLLIGVKSTAVLLGRYDGAIILGLQIFYHALWLYLALTLRYSLLFYLFWSMATLVIIYQQRLLGQRNVEAYFTAFSTNTWYGLLMWLALMN